MEKQKQIFDYYWQPKNYFWQYAENADVIEWINRTTICYTDDLLQTMRSLKDNGLPSLGVLLLLIGACNDGWEKKQYGYAILRGLENSFSENETPPDHQSFKSNIANAVKGMELIAALPSDLRKGTYRTHLIKEVVNRIFIVVKGNEVLDYVDEWVMLQRHLAEKHTRILSYTEFIRDLKCIARITELYSTPQALEQKLRTGLPAIPLPAPVAIPEQKTGGDLLQELLEEPRTTHISRLVKKMIAVLHIPMHFQRSGGQSYGGISDITNRGNFDKLLLSELANDDTILMTRLVNNEALYLRREEPPHHPKTRRLVLIDSTIKLWGKPRVFATSAAIACTQKLRPNETIEAYTLGGKTFTETDLLSKKGVLQSLEQLDASLHATEALQNCLDTIEADANGDTIFITTEENITEPLFQKWMVLHADALDFIVTVNRHGELHFNAVTAGRMKQLSRAKIDLEDILSQNRTTSQTRKIKNAIQDLPAFFKADPNPLLLPSISTKLTPKNTTYFKDFGLVSITENQRLLFWATKDKGAKELLVYIEQGVYSFGFDSNGIYILVNDLQRAILYHVSRPDLHVYRYEVAIGKSIECFSYFQQGCFYIKKNDSWNDSNSVAVVDCKTGNFSFQMLIDSPTTIRNATGKTAARVFNNFEGSSFKKFINNGYTVIVRIKRIFIDVQHTLCIDDQYFEEPSGLHNPMIIKDGADTVQCATQYKSEEQPFEENQRLWLKEFRWKDGSTVTIDARGLLHLKSSDKKLPEVSIILIQGQPTACWSSDGAICGNEYFRETIIGMMPVQSFYTRYITPIIQTIINKA